MPQNSQKNSQTKSQIGVIGLAVMGANLARNLARNGFRTSIFNRTFAKTQDLLDLQKSEMRNKNEQNSILKKDLTNSLENLEKGLKNSENEKIENLENVGEMVGFETLEKFVLSLESPRKIILMVKSGVVVEEFLDKLKPLLNSQDIVLDCGNSNWKDTERRQESLKITENEIATKIKQNFNNQNSPFLKGWQTQSDGVFLESKTKYKPAIPESKTIHLIGLFNLETLENWAKIIQKASKFDKIVLHLITGNLEKNDKENEKKLVEICQKFVELLKQKMESQKLEKNLENSLKNNLERQKSEVWEKAENLENLENLTLKQFENKIFLGSLAGIEFWQKNLFTCFEALFENPEYGNLAFWLLFLFLSQNFSPHFITTKSGSLENKLNLKLIQSQIEYLVDFRSENYRENDQNYLLHRFSFLESFGEFGFLENSSTIKKYDAVYILDDLENNKDSFGKFTEILEDLNHGFELNLEILTNFETEENLESENPKQYFHLISCGVSGGEEGALHGPSIMPSGEIEIVNSFLPILNKIAALDFQGKPCTTNIGLGPSGHFVKMVHNGIEYALMQGIAEIYDILRYNSYSNFEIREVFIELNQGELKSFLLDITVKILETKDDLSEGFLLDKIKDQAGAKGTGSWTVEAALELGVAVPTIAAAVFARSMSARNQSFNCQKKEIKPINTQNFARKPYPVAVSWLKKVLRLVFLVSYLQGLDLIAQADNYHKWQIDISEICRIWQGGCIIRSGMLTDLDEYFFCEKKLSNKILSFESGYNILPIIEIDLQTETPTPVLHSISDYILSITNKNLPTNLIQAQRDFFGAHTFERIDKLGTFTGGWEK